MCNNKSDSKNITGIYFLYLLRNKQQVLFFGANQMKFEIEKAIEILSQTPKTLKSLLGNLSEDWVESVENSDEWNPFDVIGHYIHGEKTDWILRAKIILAQAENIKFEPFDRFAQFEDSKGKSLDELLDEFEYLRKENIKTLRNLNITSKQLELKGVHPELGEVNLEQLLSTWVVHDLTHIRQITVHLAKRYSKNVGVWKKYLSILD